MFFLQWLYYWPRSGLPIESLEIVAPVSQRPLSIVGESFVEGKLVSGLSFRGLSFVGSDGADSWYLFDQRMSNSVPVPMRQGLIFMENASDVEVSGCKILSAGSSAICKTAMLSRFGRLRTRVLNKLCNRAQPRRELRDDPRQLDPRRRRSRDGAAGSRRAGRGLARAGRDLHGRWELPLDATSSDQSSADSCERFAQRAAQIGTSRRT